MLVRTPQPYPTESPLGYVLRLSEANGYSSPVHVTNLAGIGKIRNTPDFMYERLAKIVGRDENTLKLISYSRLSDKGVDEFCLLGHSLGNRRLPRVLIRMRRPAVCPRCVEEDGFIDAFFDLKHAVACPRHKCVLIERCLECSQPLSWYRPGMLTCRCEADLSKIQTAQVSDNVVDLMGILQHKLHSLPWESFRGKRGFPLEHLNNISLLSVLRLISKLAKFGTTEAEDNVPSINNMEAVASALSDWPKGFHQFLLNIGHYTNSRDTNSAGIHKWFRHINRAIFDYGRFGQDVEFLHHEYLRFALSKWGFGVIHERYLHGLEEESRYLSLLELSKRIGLNRSTLVKWVQDGRLPIKKVSTTNSIRYIVDISVTSISKQNEGKVLSARDAAKILRFPTDVLILLRKSGHFSVNHQPEQRIGYHEKDVEVFHQQLLQCSVLKEPPRLMTNVIAYTEVMAHVKFGSTSAKAKFVSGYLEGAVCSIGRWGSSLSDICFDKHYVLDYAMRSRANSLKPHLSRRLAARLLQCHETAIPGLLSASFLADVKAERGVSFICKDSLNSFLLKYISLASQANRLQTTVKRLFNIAENEGIFLLKIKSGHNLRSVSFFLLQEDQTRLDAAVVKYPTRKVSHTAR